MGKQGLKIHLIRWDARSNLSRHLTCLPHTAIVGEGAARVVQVAENHQTRLGREFALEFSKPQIESLFRDTLEATYLAPNVIENVHHRLIPHPFHPHFL